jgi:transketolase
MNQLEKRIVDISYKKRIGHLSSNLNAVNIIDEIYQTKKNDEVFILSSGHAALAMYVVMEKYEGVDALELYNKHGVHPHRNILDNIHVSTGSLGMGLTVAVGYALADRSRDIYCLISDGEAAEGSIWEALRFAYDNKLTNLKVYANVNGMSACDYIDPKVVSQRLLIFYPETQIRFTKPPEWDFASGILTHYYVLTEKDYEKIIW